MKWNLAEPRNRPRLIASMILLVGFGSAIVIYLKAGTVPGTPLEFSADSSKKYLRDLQLYGGTANVLAVQLMDWFKGLWHGRSLAFTVAIITVAVCLGYLFFAVLLPRYPSEEPPVIPRSGATRNLGGGKPRSSSPRPDPSRSLP
ncbi:MAG: hypothetical protein ABR961_09065 [Thermoanaerobaculaceae bacterium]